MTAPDDGARLAVPDDRVPDDRACSPNFPLQGVHMPILRFDFHADGRTRPGEVAVEQLVIAGWTGRDAASIQHHIDELVAVGVEPPSTVPLFYRVAAALLTQAPVIQVLGDASSGEIEPVLFGADGRLWLSLGSDHTDREAERAGVALSKQLCPKPIARAAWLWEDVQDTTGSADRLLLSSYIDEDDGPVAYQQGSLAQIVPLASLVAGLQAAHRLTLHDGVMMFCGTLGAIGGVRSSHRFSGRLEDPLASRALNLEYVIDTLPVVA